MTTYRWTHDTPLVRHETGERIEHGQLFEPTDHEQRVWPGRMVTQATEEIDACTAVKQDGDVCGRKLPCRYHSE